MPRRVPRLSLRLSLLLLALPLAALRGQTPPQGMDAVETQYKKHRQLIGQLLKGEIEADPKDKNHAEAIDALAKYATLRFLSDLDQKAPGKMDSVYQTFDRDVASIERAKDRGKALGQAYTHQIILYSKQVLRDGRPVAQVNVARVLARLADLGPAELADALVEIIKDPALKNDAVRYYAFRGLHALLAKPAPAPPDPPVVSKAQEEKAVAVLVEFVQRKVPFRPGTPRPEVDGYRVVRREAIRALAQTHNPVVGGARPALVLLRVAGRDEAVVPEPRLDERLEASIGVARMRPAGAAGYQPDYAAAVLGRFVVEFVNAANGNKADKQALRSRPWRIDAARLGEALEELKAGAKGDKYLQELAGRALPLLVEVENGRQPDPSALNTWLSGNEPPHKELFKDVPESAIKPAAAGE